MTPLATSSPRTENPAPTGKTKHPNGIKIVIANCQGLKSKKEAVAVMLNTINPDVFIGTESHLDSSTATSEVLPPNYATQTHRRDRPSKGGGVFISARDDIMATELPELNPPGSETVWSEIQITGKKLLVGAHYRPPKSKDAILNDLNDSIQSVTTKYKNSDIIIGGDFNLASIDWDTLSTTPGGSDIAQCNILLNTTNRFNLEQLVSEPTRGENTLDLCFTTLPGLTKRCTTGPGISDHDHLVILETQLRARPNKKKPHTVNLYSKTDWEKVKREVAHMETEFHESRPLEKTTQENWTFFKDGLKKIMNNNIPTKKIRSKHNLPWFNRAAKHLLRQKKKAYHRAKRSKKTKDWIRFRQLRKAYQQNLRRAHWDYLNSILDPSEDKNSKGLWRYIKAQKQENVGVSTLKSGGKVITDAKGKASALNDQFTSVFTRENTNLIPDKGPSPYPDMPPIRITNNGVKKLLDNIQAKKATGPDGIPARVLKEASTQISPILATIFQQSIDTGSVPDDWREANVTPIFKKGSKSTPANYRPVSLTSIPCKILEHIVVSNILGHLDEHNILVDCQHGFRRRRSCETQLTITAHDLALALNKHQQVDMAILDFSKAFDKVPHQRLAGKLDYYGIRNTTSGWINNFLRERSQRVLVDGEQSETGPVISGVPQGTVIGPLLFLIFINDITQEINATVRLFADDCLVYRTIQTEEDSQALQSDLNKLDQWSKDWQMAFNVSKCYVLRVTLARKHIIKATYTMNHQVLETVASNPYLGVELDSKLNWDTHINIVSSKSNRILGFLRRNLWHCPRQVKERAYLTLVRPKLEYCSPIWNPHQGKYIKKIEAVQRQAARFVLQKPHRNCSTESVTDMVNSLGWPTLETRIPEMYKPCPKGQQTTRRPNHQQMEHYQCEVNAFRYSLLPRTVPLWNRLPEEIVSAPELDAFKQRLSTYPL
jgi:hypothetical protein